MSGEWVLVTSPTTITLLLFDTDVLPGICCCCCCCWCCWFCCWLLLFEFAEHGLPSFTKTGTATRRGELADCEPKKLYEKKKNKTKINCSSLIWLELSDQSILDDKKIIFNINRTNLIVLILFSHRFLFCLTLALVSMILEPNFHLEWQPEEMKIRLKLLFLAKLQPWKKKRKISNRKSLDRAVRRYVLVVWCFSSAAQKQSRNVRNIYAFKQKRSALHMKCNISKCAQNVELCACIFDFFFFLQKAKKNPFRLKEDWDKWSDKRKAFYARIIICKHRNDCRL